MGEVFLSVGRYGFFTGCGFAPDWWVGCVGRVYAFRKCRLIPPHQSLTRQTACSFLPPPRGSLCKIPFISYNRAGEWNFGSLFGFVILLVS